MIYATIILAWVSLLSSCLLAVRYRNTWYPDQWWQWVAVTVISVALGPVLSLVLFYHT